MSSKLQRILHPFATRRAARIEKYLQSENIEYKGVIDTKRRALEEEVRRLTVAHNARFAGGVSAPGLLERTLLPVRLEYLRGLMQARIEIRRRLGQECPDLLSVELEKLEEEMIRTVDTFRAARDDDYKRRVAASGMPEARSLYRDDAEYGEVVALIRREVRQLRLGRELGRGKKPAVTRDQKLVIVGIVIALVALVITAMTVPEVRRWAGLDTPAAAQKTEGFGKR
jgi:hypothetical protein